MNEIITIGERVGAGSNSLPDLAARIRVEHEATATALKTSVGHAMAAGELLIEAKALLKHGEWLLGSPSAVRSLTAQHSSTCGALGTARRSTQIRNALRI
jgi:hypothetical protein